MVYLYPNAFERVFGNDGEDKESLSSDEVPLSPVQQFYENANILITGGTGFIGMVLVEKLLSRICKFTRCYNARAYGGNYVIFSMAPYLPPLSINMYFYSSKRACKMHAVADCLRHKESKNLPI
ncbi:hypothetical protein BC332_34618 [Capsicum chinense]|nr:hypothetical protein BC332_34618 [Capsicum chinense]